MAARGSEAKAQITAKILEMFPNAFAYEKELRIPVLENGEEVQIKVTLTAAKTNVNAGAESSFPQAQAISTAAEITPEEKQEVISLIDRLGL